VDEKRSNICAFVSLHEMYLFMF